MGARDFPCMVSGFSQVFKVTHVKKVGFRPKICWPADDTKTYFLVWKKSLLPQGSHFGTTRTNLSRLKIVAYQEPSYP